MELVGYCFISPKATTGRGANIETFIGKECRVMEFADDGSVFVLNPQATDLAMFEKQDVLAKFECSNNGFYIVPPNLNFIDKMFYTEKLRSRKGGYNEIVKSMVITASLHKGVYNDNFLFQMEREENARKQQQQ